MHSLSTPGVNNGKQPAERLRKTKDSEPCIHTGFQNRSVQIGFRFASMPYIRMPADTEAFREEIVPRIGRLTM